MVTIMIPVIKSKGNCHECFREDFFYFRSFHFSDTFHQRFMILWFSDIIRTIKPIKFLTLTQTLWFITINYHSEHFDFSNINETGIFWPWIDLNRSSIAMLVIQFCMLVTILKYWCQKKMNIDDKSSKSVTNNAKLSSI